MKKILIFSITVLFALTSTVFALNQPVYPIKGEHKGGNLVPKDAYRKFMENPENTFLVDVRTRYEYQDVGHPVWAYNIPWQFHTTKVGKKGYEKVLNKIFCEDLKARFNTKTDSLLFICRSGVRSIFASTRAVDCGFKEEKVFMVLGGFEGDKIKDKNSPYFGERMLGGWRLEDLPWTYKMDLDFIYKRDIVKK